MIKFNDIPSYKPYELFKDYYEKALSAGQSSIEAICISSSINDEVDSRFVNLKYITGDEWIFFSNYNSPKALQFLDNKNIACIFYWNKINIQIRLKAKIRKTNKAFSDDYFSKRLDTKNALAISSDQSRPVNSYEDVISRYEHTLSTENLIIRPEYWGGYSFTPYYFEFWEGHESRLNKREAYEKSDDGWKHLILQP